MPIDAALISRLNDSINQKLSVPKTTTQEVVESFADKLRQAMNETSNLQNKADDLVQKLAVGKVQDVHQVMAAVEEASLAMQLTLQLRNKALDAYQEIMRMQV